MTLRKMTVRRFVRELCDLREHQYWRLRGRGERLRMCGPAGSRWLCPIVAMAVVRGLTISGESFSSLGTSFAASLLGLSTMDRVRIMLAADWTVRDRWGVRWWMHVDAWRHWWLRRRLLQAVGLL